MSGGRTGQAAPRSVAVIMACHNRCALTLQALRSVTSSQGALALQAIVFDDGSTDGTKQAVNCEFPEATVLDGKGDGFWNGGMHQAWNHARSLGVQGYLWLNDDVRLDADAISRLAAAWERFAPDEPVILVGATRDAAGKASYGGLKRRRSPFAFAFERLSLDEGWQEVDTFNGNIVLVSHAVVERIGLNDPHFLHALGDIDYGLRAKAAGIAAWLLPGSFGVCDRNQPIDLAAMSLRQRLRLVQSHRGLPLSNWWRITRRHSGRWFPLHFVLAYRRYLFSRRVG